MTYAETAGKLHHLLSLDVLEAVDTGDTVTNGQHAAGLLKLGLSRGLEDAFLQDAGDLCGAWYRI